ncbi:MAG: histidine kinase [Nocardioides sp.]|uniref:sensor histidine kinase n=1 Tax=Nocardioides sp. TaxID=35761 RepID=UPI0032666CB3
MTRTDAVLRTGAVALGVALLGFAVPRADPADPGTSVGLLLVVAAVACALLGRGVSDTRAATWALLAGAAVVAVTVGQTATATVVERDLRIGMLPLVLPLVAAVLIRSPTLATVAAAGGFVAGPGRMLVYDPFLDPGCVACAPGRIVLWPAPLLATVLTPVGIAMATTAVILALVSRRSPLELLALLGCLAAFSANVAGDPLVLVGAMIASFWLVRTTTVAWYRRTSVHRLLRTLDEGDDLTTVLRRDLGDDSLIVTFPDGDDLITRSGAVGAPAPGQELTDLMVQGTLVARIHHAPATRVPELTAGLDAPARLALGNERLTAQLAARVGELTRARADLVESGVRERRVLERDLHDGAQQDLLALGLDLRVAASALGPEDPRRVPLEEAVLGVHRALDDLRNISHGVYPPLLATRGLAAAVASLARRTSTTLEIGPIPDGRFPDAIERAAFAVIAEAVDRGARHLSVTVADGRLRVQAEHAGPGVDGILPDLVAAVGGVLDLDQTITAVIPCA